METTFYIEFDMKTPDGFETFGCFDIGNDRQFALTLFSKLKGERKADETSILHMDLVEKFRGLPVGIQVISCTMDDLCGNVKTITRELFKRLSLDEVRRQ